MATRSSIKKLPAEIRAALNDWLKEGAVSITEATELINAELTEWGYAPVSRSAVGRHHQRLHQIGERVRQAREIAEAWGESLSEDDGQMTAAILHTLRGLVLEVSLAGEKGENGEIRLSPQDASHLARALKQLEQTADIGTQRVARAKDEALTVAANQVESSAQRQGLSPEAVDELRRAVMGG